MGVLPRAYLLSVVQINRSDPTPVYRQIYESLRQAINCGQLEANLRLPSTRDMAELLGVSRNTVLDAVGQLVAEGYLETRQGSGTYVTGYLPDGLLRANGSGRATLVAGAPKRTVSRRGELLAGTEFTPRRHTNPRYVFTIGMPAVEEFPFDVWSRLMSRHYRHGPLSLFDYNLSEPAGYPPLRAAIAAYLKTARAMQCDSEQVIICNGSQQALFIASRVLLDAGDKAWIEDPGYLGARWALHSAEAQVIPVSVDMDGLIVEEGIAKAPDARLVYVTPSLQFPIGCTMNLKRRSELLNWANRNDAWIVEDDYDHEFRYVGHPLMSLQGLDSAGRVIYIGTFSKVMFPALRMGYVVVPKDLVNIFTSVRTLMDLRTPTVQQAAMNDFIREGHFMRHIRRARGLYARRRRHLLEQIDEHLGGLLTPGISDAGMHLVGWLPDSISDELVFSEAEKIGVEILPISRFYIGEPDRSGIILGYTAAHEADITWGVRALKDVLLRLQK